MAANEPSSLLLEIPLHIVAHILCQLDSISQLHDAVLSHSIFHAAFQDNTYSTIGSILTNRIPLDILPFALALLKSGRIAKRDTEAGLRLLRQLKTTILDPSIATSSILELSISDAAQISRDYEAVQFLIKDLVEETIPVLNERLEVNHPPDISAQERVRLNRAFFRYQLMCNLLCRRYDLQALDDKITETFFEAFSPWVNAQLACVYGYLERKVGEAFDDVAAHDVGYGELPVYWNEKDNAYLQEFLSCGLPFLGSVIRARSFDERIDLLDLSLFKARSWDCWPCAQLQKMDPDEEHPEIEIMVPTHTRRDDLSQLSQPLDEKHDAAGSGPSQTWLSSHFDNGFMYPMFDDEDRNLWECGYAFWDSNETGEMTRSWEEWKKIRALPRHFQRQFDWPWEEMLQSQKQRADIWLAGGGGYWPRDGFDFGKIQGLKEEDKERLLSRWRAQGGKSQDS
ncbi:hypothetical protein B0T10DRAFT_233905 [Thelonectria olida]|uniref:Uncharacterized protein n=1 Tax=Thelonectria olida TaxID=1576542 RepID=A0A9P8VUV1_9HYPO|nr:hypothetical protein B0T10DRAFT_233905 [Thelonectria olida]